MDESAVSQKLFRALTQKGLQPVLKTAYDILGLPIAVADSSFKMLAPNYPPTDQGFDIWDLPQKRKYVPLEIVSIFYREDILPRVMDNPGTCIYVDWGEMKSTPCLTTAICYEGRIEGFIAAYCPRDKLCNWHFNALPLIADAVGIALSKENLVHSSGNPLAETFLNRLFSGAVEPGEIQYWNDTLCLSLTGNYAALNLCAVKNSPESLKNFIRRHSIDTGDRFLTISHNGALAVLAYGIKNNDVLNCLCNRISAFFEHLDVYCGVSDIFFELSETPAYMCQAKLSCDIGIRKNPDVSVHHFSSYRLPAIISELSRLNDLKIYLNPAILKLKDYDSFHGSDLFNTLKTFLYARCNMLAASSELHIHRNTLLYRLERIEHKTGINLSDTESAIELYLSFLIYDELNLH